MKVTGQTLTKIKNEYTKQLLSDTGKLLGIIHFLSAGLRSLFFLLGVDTLKYFFPLLMRTFALLSERALRGVKTKTKVSGQFASTETADYYAAIRTYIETCRRNGINEMAALMRLCSGNPYTVEEIFRQDSQSEKHSCH